MARRTDDEDLDYGDVDAGFEKRQAITVSRAFKLPAGVTQFKFDSAATLRFNIMPFRCGDDNPCQAKGKIWWERTFFVHQNIGPDRKTVCCLRKNWGEKCPICEEQVRLTQKTERGDENGYQRIRDLDCKDRQLLALVNVESAALKVQIAEASYAAFGERLQIKLKLGNAKNGYKDFFKLKGGKTIVAQFEKKPLGKGNSHWFKCEGIEMEDREEDYPSSMLEKVPCLDELLIKLPYNSVYSILHGVDAGDDDSDDDSGKRVSKRDDDDDRPAGKSASKKPADDDGDDDGDNDGDDNETTTVKLEKGDIVWHPEHGRCEVMRVSGDGTSVTLYNEENDERHTAISPDECLTGKEAEAAAKKAKAKAKAEESDPEEPEDKPKKAPAKPKTWGDDDDPPAKPAKKK